MAEPYHLIEEKAEAAVSAWLQDKAKTGSLTGATIVVGGDGVDLAYPLITIVATDAEPDTDNNGNYDVTISVTIESSLTDSTRSEHSALAGSVCDVLVGRVWDDIAGEINGLASPVADFTAIYWEPGTRTRTVDADDESRITEQLGVLTSAPSTI